MKLKFKYFAIDFDGTIAYDAYPEIGDLIPGAKETMEKIKELGGSIIIWTCRSGEHEELVKKYLHENNIPYDKFNEPFDENLAIYGGENPRKCFSDVYIDDRCILFKERGYVDWASIQHLIFEE
jgi:ribonucleotide monophosphatase NagD (HAD superfamily)